MSVLIKSWRRITKTGFLQLLGKLILDLVKTNKLKIHWFPKILGFKFVSDAM